ncbi:zinc finger protein 358-like [Drosophila teissieri]|uniref:zinc finger protein 358-like n=1 Tax=Drosophila teissieri TaxID=7243 RepID=UPI001CBA23F4|nr:zinc finger protein 358-like [Drosophila teissieri]
MEGNCRVCLGDPKDGQLISIFVRMPKLDICIADMIAESTGFRVTPGDSLPKTICPSCLEHAKNAFQVRKTCERSYQFFCQVRDEGIEEATCTLLEEEDWEFSDKETECAIPCNTPKPNGAKLKEDIRLPSKSLRGNWVQGYQCPFCSRSCANDQVLKIHIRCHTAEKPFRCPHCPNSFAEKSTLDAHVRIHAPERPYQCSKCFKSFAKGFDLQQHLGNPCGLRPHQCPHCGKFFARKSRLRDHIRGRRRKRASRVPSVRSRLP